MKFINRLIAFILVFSFFSGMFHIIANADSTLNVSAKSACMIDADSGKILYSKNPSKKMPMASTTKVMTAIIALESNIPLNKVIVVPEEAIGIEGSSIYLAEGEKITFEVLLYALLLSSANDAAVAIAIIVGGNTDNFVALMNQKAALLGLTNTHFTNPHGLYDENHYTTALDLAHLMTYAIKNPAFVEISGCPKKVFPKQDEGVRVMINHNKLLNTYDGVIAGKTGFTKKSGRCLVTSASRNNLNLIAVTLEAPNDWNDHKSLYNFGFSNYKRVIFEPISVDFSVIGGKKDNVKAVANNKISLLLPQSTQIKRIIKAPRFLFAEIKKGEEIGRVVYICNGKEIASSLILASENVQKTRYRFNLFEFLKELLF